MGDLEKALGLVAEHFPGTPPEIAIGFAERIEFATNLRKTAVPVDARNADRLNDILRIQDSLREWERLFKADYPDLMINVRDMVERERCHASAALSMKRWLGPPDYALVKALAGVYRAAAGKELPSAVVHRVTGQIVRNGFADFVLSVFSALCDGEPPSLDTIRRAVDDLRMAANP